MIQIKDNQIRSIVKKHKNSQVFSIKSINLIDKLKYEQSRVQI